MANRQLALGLRRFGRLEVNRTPILYLLRAVIAQPCHCGNCQLLLFSMDEPELFFRPCMMHE